jgi:hypothetical protein
MCRFISLINARQILFSLSALACVACLVGCIDRCPEAEQRVRVALLEKATRKPVDNAMVCSQVPANGFTDLLKAILEYKHEQKLDCGTTDVEGVVDVPVTVNAPLSGPVADGLTGGALAFRVDSEGRSDLFFDDKVEVGKILPGRTFDLKILEITPPVRRNK